MLKKDLKEEKKEEELEEEEYRREEEVNHLKSILWKQLNEGIELKDDFLDEEKKVKSVIF